ncbi:MAG: AAA ATPase domain containing protein [Candidatus Magnetoglobus multicellularis str. Araruama]|uniref:AAA ATPase domain protein n=2 Tax=Candidatus Magnetoglobus multicellularis TaxID=418099 RepID=F4ZYT2_9BACT|nr:AAA ATPase domain protein [Candidatus Magnetoglobus multicellularis]ETR64727.1 MAG: AAA ATPase domain containing protein [Candidatus Magnetoglobus multicellularis str. Araruama]
MRNDFQLAVKPHQNLSLAKYDNYHDDLQVLLSTIKDNGRKTILWNHARGFMLDYLSENYVSNEIKSGQVFSKPGEALRFIINRPQKGIDYILEDFHHFIGSKESYQPNVGEIRALVKELSREFNSREQTVFFFVPSAYQLPSELDPFFRSVEKNETQSTNLLDKYGVLLNSTQRIRKTKPLIGCENYILRLTQILSQMEINNPLLIGQPGVGKTAIVEGFARELHNGFVPDCLQDKLLYHLSLNSIVAGTRFRGDFEDRLEGLMKEVLDLKDQIIIFIDEIHTILNAGSAEGAMSAGEILKPVLSRGEFPCIGATTFADAEIFSKDRALARRFRKIVVHEPTPEETFRILKGVAKCFETYHDVKIEEIALMATIEESMEILKDEYLPGKAIALLDSTCAFCKMNNATTVGEDDILEEVERMAG